LEVGAGGGSLGRVNRKTEEFLNFLLWGADVIMNPSYSNMTRSYDAWRYRNGFDQRVNALRKRGFLEPKRKRRGAGYRLTKTGRMHTLGGRDPNAQWSRKWDGRWRIVVFDVPIGNDRRRQQLRRCLREQWFGCLQGSVWITPDAFNQPDLIGAAKVPGESLFLVEAELFAGRPQEIVECARDFRRINSCVPAAH
jgi:hypothetical protein